MQSDLPNTQISKLPWGWFAETINQDLQCRLYKNRYYNRY